MYHYFAEMDAQIANSNVFERELLHQCFTLDVDALTAESAPLKARVVDSVNQLGPPPQFRLIDCRSTMQQRRVVLVDGRLHQHAYTIISHTSGEDVYAVFNCECACRCYASVPRSDSRKPCPGRAHASRHAQVVADILKMCERLMAMAGSEFLWHDGVCIAQHNAKEVEETIQHMGWLYANATDTIIFLDYVGTPRPLLLPHEPYYTRWNTRVWTLQEAILSKRRRYCIRTVSSPYVDSLSIANLEAALAHSYMDDSCIKVVEEEIVWVYVVYLFYSLCMIIFRDFREFSANLKKVAAWLASLRVWIFLLKDHCFRFPTLSSILRECAGLRESKHEGDRINAVLALAGITDFVAPKDDDFEASSIEFFKRLNGQDVILEALFWVNCWVPDDFGKKHTWLPSLSTFMSTASLKMVQHPMHHATRLCLSQSLNSLVTRFLGVSVPRPLGPTRGVVMENGMLHLRGHLRSVAGEFTFENLDHNSELRPLKVDEDKQRYIKNGMLLMDVKMAAFGVDAGCYESFARASSTKLGRATFPLCVQAIGEHVVQGRLMAIGSSCYAHLVFATDLMMQGEEEGGCTRPAALIVAGDLRHPVYKLGRFSAHSTLTPIISSKNLVPFTMLDHLVIV